MYTVMFSAGETIASFDVQIIDDDLIENDEILQFMILRDLLPDDVGSGIPNMATLIIIDDSGNDIYLAIPCSTSTLCIHHTHIMRAHTPCMHAHTSMRTHAHTCTQAQKPHTAHIHAYVCPHTYTYTRKVAHIFNIAMFL